MTAEFTTACPDWEQRIVEGRSLIPFAVPYPDMAARALDIFNRLAIVDIAPKEDGSPQTFGDVARPWVTDWASAIFGTYNSETGRRLVTEFFELIAKKNTKSTKSAGIMLTALVLNWRKSNEFLIVAPTIEIANNSFFPARDMVNADDELREIMLVQEHYRTITHRVTKASLKVVAADSEAVSGKKAGGVLFDEFWLFGKKAGADNMIREATGGLAARPEGFRIDLSTQSDEPPSGVFAQRLRYARKVRDGKIKDSKFLPVLYEYPEAMLQSKAYKNPKNFYIANPNLGASVDVEWLEREAVKAEEGEEDDARGFWAKHFNIQVGMASGVDQWAGAEYWVDAQVDMTFAELLERCEVVTLGIDGGGLQDLLGLSAVGREKATGSWLGWSHAWAHPIAFQRNKKVDPNLKDFVREGDLTVVDKVGDDIAQLADYVEQAEKAGVLERIGVDQAGLGFIVDAICAKGIALDRIVGIPQGWKMISAILTTERKLSEGTLKVSRARMMVWCVGNARIERKGNAQVVTKQVSGAMKIDPLLSTFNAVTLMSLNPAPVKKTYDVHWLNVGS